MRLVKRSDSAKGFLPDAYQYLSTAPSIPSVHKKARRPPIGVYNVSIERVVRSLSRVTDLLVSLITQCVIPKQGDGLEWLKPVVDAHVEVLNAMQSHIDDCDEIAKAALGATSPWKTDGGRRYKALASEYRDRVNRIVNHIKHHLGRLRAFSFYTPSECFPGYYVEGVDQEGLVGPEPTVHKQGRGAFSFSRDIRLHFVWIYGLSTALGEVLAKAVERSSCVPSTIVDDKKYFALAERIEKIPAVFFPDEGSSPVPEVCTHKSDRVSTLHVSYALDVRAPLIPQTRHMRIATVWQGDGVTKNFRLPYPFREGPDNVASLHKTR